MYTVHLVSHTHWDREWYLTFQQFRLKLVQLVDGLLDLLEADPNYRHFMLDGQAIILEDYLHMRPERQADLRRHIQSGRILVGPWYILPDEFLVSPEATLRNLLQGRRSLEKFAPAMPVGYLPDTFGHIGQMPQILRGFGINTASVMRGLGDEPCELWWQAPDGSRLLLAYLRESYSNAASLPLDDLERSYHEIERLAGNLAAHAASQHLLLMQGTDHMQPQPATSRLIAYAREKASGRYILLHSTLPAYLAALQASLERGELLETQLPTITGELRGCQRHPLLPNVLSSRMWIKQRNHACELLLEKWCEPFSTWADWAGGDARPQASLRHPAGIIRQAWRLLMENHPHDSICGCSIDQVHAEMRPRFDQVEQIGEELTRQSLEALAEIIDTTPLASREGEQNPTLAIVVYNPTCRARTDWVECTLELPQGVNDFDLLDADGAIIPYQRLGLGGRELVHMTFERKEFRSALGMVSEGRVAGMGVQDLQVRQEGPQCFIEVVLSETAEPNLEAWQEGIRAVSALLEDASVTTYHVHARSVAATRLLFCAPVVPGLGYRTFWLRGKPGNLTPPQRLGGLAGALLPLAARLAQNPGVVRLLPDPARRPPYRIENEFFSVEADRSGTLTLHDRRNGTVYRGLNRFVDGGDCGDEYNYCPPERDTCYLPRLKYVRVLRGAVRQALELHLELRLPLELAADRKKRSTKMVRLPILSRVSLMPGVPRLDVHTQVENHARDHRLRVHFPAPFMPGQDGLSAAFADHDGHFAVVRRRVGGLQTDPGWIEQPRPEVPQRAFTLILDGNHAPGAEHPRRGLLVANRGLPEVEVLLSAAGSIGKSEIALTLLRCVGWLSRDDLSTRKGHAGPALPTPEAQMPGKWSFDYAILPYAGDDIYTLYHQAYAFQAPLRAVSASPHAGSLPSQASMLAIEPAGFVVSSIKACENGRAWLVRGYNLSEDEIHVQLKPWRPFAHAALADLAEQPLADLPASADGSLDLTLGGHAIVTIIFS